MTRSDFDPDVDWSERNGEPEEGDEDLEVFPPDLLSGYVQGADQVQKEMPDPYPGNEQEGKKTNPDEWDH